MKTLNAQTPQVELRSPSKIIFFASLLALFLELALIRWVSCEIRIFAYFKNLVLIACFLGFGTGCFLSRKPANILISVVLLVVLCLLIQPEWQPLKEYGPSRISRILAEMPGLMIFKATQSAITWSRIPSLLFALSWSLLLFFMLAIILIPFGQLVAHSMELDGNPLRAYSLNVLGSLVGILLYTFATTITLPPICWFVPVALSCVWLSRERFKKPVLILTGVLVLILFPYKNPEKQTYWSSYQKLEVVGDRVYVNNIGYQGIWAQPDFTTSETMEWNGNTMPYAVRRPAGRVLIIGAGAGNDAAAALRAGASSVTAVEIDAIILDIGRRLHPQQPYSDPRVKIVLDDARHFLQTNKDRFDLIVFSHLDSHTVLSSFTNVRLDDYIYTVESMQEARKHLDRDGILYLVFWSEQPYVTSRLGQNLFSAFGHGPLQMIREGQGPGGKVQLAFFFTGEPDVIPKLQPATQAIGEFRQLQHLDEAQISSDAWPFLPLSHPHIPVLVQILSAMILACCAIVAWKAKPRGERFDGRMFWLGAAFLLVEVHNVSRLALVFGTTWQVNAWVIGAILGVILIANWIVISLERHQNNSRKWMFIGLFASLAIAYFFPLRLLLGYSHVIGGAISTFILTLPIFFAALVFANSFRSSSAPAFALGWNVLGAGVGGMAESLSYVYGIPSLMVVAALFYLLAVLWPGKTLESL